MKAVYGYWRGTVTFAGIRNAIVAVVCAERGCLQVNHGQVFEELEGYPGGI